MIHIAKSDGHVILSLSFAWFLYQLTRYIWAELRRAYVAVQLHRLNRRIDRALQQVERYAESDELFEQLMRDAERRGKLIDKI